jgi:hypothetical protein
LQKQRRSCIQDRFDDFEINRVLMHKGNEGLIKPLA